MNRILQWAIGSTAFKKANSVIGGFALGLWTSATYWREIKATLAVWGVERDTWLRCLLAVAAAAGLSLSVGLSAAKTRQDKAKVTP